MTSGLIKICEVTFSSNFTRSITDDHWDIVDPEYSKCWRAAAEKASRKVFKHKDHNIEIKIDLSPLLTRLQHQQAVTRILHTADLPTRANAIHDYKIDNVVVNGFCSEFGSKQSRVMGIFLNEYYLHDLFLIMNLCSPGSCDMYNTSINEFSEKSGLDIKLSNYHFDCALLRGIDRKWPHIAFLPFDKVFSWFNRCRPSLKMLPKSRTERAIFALLHLAKTEISPNAITWIFYALEALFDTKPGENFRALFERLCLIHRPSDQQAKEVRRDLRDLYDLRSAFVHGGLEVMHPMQNERLDHEINNAIGRLMGAIDFGSTLLISSIQFLIANDWPEFVFRESATGGLWG